MKFDPSERGGGGTSFNRAEGGGATQSFVVVLIR